jgi:hypothetical protein
LVRIWVEFLICFLEIFISRISIWFFQDFYIFNEFFSCPALYSSFISSVFVFVFSWIQSAVYLHPS